MKKIAKQLLALTLAMIVAVSFMPVKAQAAGPKVTLAKSGSVKTILYKGAKAKKGSYSLSAVKEPKEYVKDGNYYGEKGSKDEGKAVYNRYNVTFTLKQPKIKKRDIVKIVKEINKKKFGGKYVTFAPLLIDSNGNEITDLDVNGGLDTSKSSSVKVLTAHEGRRYYRMYNWRQNLTFEYTIYVPVGRTDVNFGFAGLRSGQLKKTTLEKYEKHTISYYSAGFGKNKKGFIIAGNIIQ